MTPSGFVAGGSARSLWRCFTQVVGGTLHGERALGKIKGAGWGVWARELVADSGRTVSSNANSGAQFSAGRFDAPAWAAADRKVSRGLQSLLSSSHRADVRTMRSFFSLASAAVAGRSGQLNLGRGSDCSSAALSSGRKLHSAAGHELRSASLATRGTDRYSSSRPGLISVPRRDLSAGNWAERWEKATEKLKKAINLKPKSNTGAEGVPLKGAPREIIAEFTKPVQSTFSRYREAVGLQVEAFWKRNYIVVIAIVGMGICLLLWRLMFGIASTFITLSEGLAKFGFLALAAAMVVVGGVVLRARYTINPNVVYRIAMRKLNTSAAVLEVMGAPLAGTDLRAYIMSGGGLRMNNFRPRLAGKRCCIIFPIQGSERRGLVSIEVKKKKGQYDFKLLAVDVPTAGADQRLYLIGDGSEYKGLISELRDPMVKAMAAQKEFEDQDMKEEEEDERKELEAERLRAQEEEKRLQDELEKTEELNKAAEEEPKDEKGLRNVHA